MISVITVTLNAEKTLEETLLSITQQTCQDFEIVAVDGGSTDSTIDIFQKYSSYIGTLISEKDSGIYNAMNKGIRAAKGDYLFFLNAQDTLYSKHVFANVEDAFNSANRPFLVFGDVFFTNKASNEMKERIAKMVDCGDQVWVSTFHRLCVLILRRFIDKFSGFTTNFTIYADMEKNRLLKEVYKQLNIEDDEVKKSIDYHISNIKNNNADVDDYTANIQGFVDGEKVKNAYNLYQKMLRQNNALDFDDLLFGASGIIYELFGPANYEIILQKLKIPWGFECVWLFMFVCLIILIITYILRKKFFNKISPLSDS